MALNSGASVIDCANYVDSTLLEKADMLTKKEVDSGVLNFDLIINANPTDAKEVEAKSNYLGLTLATPSHENHMAFKLEQIQQIPTTSQWKGKNRKILGHGSVLCANLTLMRLKC